MRTHYDAEEYEFEKELVGKSIKSIDEDNRQILLTDGTLLEVSEGGDCCAWFDGAIRTVNLTQNVITKIDRLCNDEEDGLFTLAIYSVNEHIASVEVTGNEGSGYYGSSITLTARQLPADTPFTLDN